MSVLSKLQNIVSSVNTVTGESDTTLTDAVQTLVDGYEAGVLPQTLSYSQIDSIVKAYLDYVSQHPYDPDDLTVSYISTFTGSYHRDKPAGAPVPVHAGKLTITDNYTGGSFTKSVSNGNVTVYDIIPSALGGSYVNTDANGDAVSCGTLFPEGSLRMINGYSNTFNIRDIGGWECDGGTLKYGKLIRGSELNGDNYNVSLTDEQKELFLRLLKVADEIDLRGDSEVDGDDDICNTADDITQSALGDSVSYVRYPVAAYASGVDLSNPAQTALYRELIKRIVQDAATGKTVYLHCMAGADRTGTAVMLIEAICGVSRSDCDCDYELTSFCGEVRKRSDANWKALMIYLDSLPGDTFRDKAVYYALKAGVSIDEINALRFAMTDGEPDTLVSPFSPAQVSAALTHAVSSNTNTGAAMYQPYEAQISADSGYVIGEVHISMGGIDITDSVWDGKQVTPERSVTADLSNCTSDNAKSSVILGEGYGAGITAQEGYTLTGAEISITMGGVEVSAQYYSNGKIAIPSVTGDIVISVAAVADAPAYVNQLPLSTDTDGSVYNGVGYKSPVRISSSGEAKSITEAYYSASLGTTGFIPCSVGDTIYISGAVIDPSDEQAVSYNIAVYNSAKEKLEISPWSILSDRANISCDLDGNVVSISLLSGRALAAEGVAYIRLCALGINSGTVITVNQPIV